MFIAPSPVLRALINQAQAAGKARLKKRPHNPHLIAATSGDKGKRAVIPWRARKTAGYLIRAPGCDPEFCTVTCWQPGHRARALTHTSAIRQKAQNRERC